MSVWVRLRSATTVVAIAAALVTGAVVGEAQAQGCQPYGAIGGYWYSVGAQSSWLGGCINDEHDMPGGRVESFQAGAIYWSPQTGARSVKGAIREYFNSIGATTSFLGLPVTHETPTPTRFGAFNHFQGGSIYWSPATGAHEVHGAIRDAWAGQGWERDWVGFPTSNEYSVAGGRQSDFQGGSISWNASNGAISFTRSNAAASTLGARALAAAKTKIGVPYQWGATGPNSFDCSGLTQWSFRQVGLNIPRVAEDQARAGMYVAPGDLQAGDLVFFYNPISHVGIYDGNGSVVNAPAGGQNVKVTPIRYMPYTTARRYG